MKKLVICSAVVLAIASITNPVFADTSAIDQMYNRNHMFGLESGDWKILNRGQEAKTYRICMTKDEGAEPLRVAHDGQQTIVQPGDCHVIQAKKIKVASAGKLDDGLILVGRRRVDNGATPGRLVSARSATPSGP